MIKNFEKLPQDVQDKVKSILRCYDAVHINFEYGKYEVTTSVCIKATYGPDHKVIGTMYKNDIYTPTEQMENYINSFRDYPIEYKGNKDYVGILKKMETEREFDWTANTLTHWIGKINEVGNFVLTHKETVNL